MYSRAHAEHAEHAFALQPKREGAEQRARGSVGVYRVAFRARRNMPALIVAVSGELSMVSHEGVKPTTADHSIPNAFQYHTLLARRGYVGRFQITAL